MEVKTLCGGGLSKTLNKYKLSTEWLRRHTEPKPGFSMSVRFVILYSTPRFFLWGHWMSAQSDKWRITMNNFEHHGWKEKQKIAVLSVALKSVITNGRRSESSIMVPAPCFIQKRLLINLCHFGAQLIARSYFTSWTDGRTTTRLWVQFPAAHCVFSFTFYLVLHHKLIQHLTQPPSLPPPLPPPLPSEEGWEGPQLPLWPQAQEKRVQKMNEWVMAVQLTAAEN